ncbi:DUF1107 domain-containing protein [Shewanella sp. Isolate11]|uniref:DUF1107 domain-containing protein n=1 Tax=Shewanella sp. Isolate11 TaxID=2908530 RepID=UPI001EFD9F3B|nr:DUF1107 domain-containing protein [Shewanella sp. Isolate11]MCG9695397.1 DUF1107 domain-containing protein [Shewanella sp. Isolate11]
MRVFPVYAPKLIIKHVRIFVSGVIWVKDLGRLEFDKGRFLLPREQCLPQVKQAILELNQLIQSQHANEAKTA